MNSKSNYLQLFLFSISKGPPLYSDILLREMEKEYGLPPMDQKKFEEWMEAHKRKEEMDRNFRDFANSMNN